MQTCFTQINDLCRDQPYSFNYFAISIFTRLTNCVCHPWWHSHRMQFVGPGVLACATRGGGRSEAGRCFHLLIPPFFFFFSFFLLRFLLFTHFGETPETVVYRVLFIYRHCTLICFLRSRSLDQPLFSSSKSSAFHPLRGNSRFDLFHEKNDY